MQGRFPTRVQVTMDFARNKLVKIGHTAFQICAAPIGESTIRGGDRFITEHEALIRGTEGKMQTGESKVFVGEGKVSVGGRLAVPAGEVAVPIAAG